MVENMSKWREKLRVTLSLSKVAMIILVCYLVVSCFTGFIIMRNNVWKQTLQQKFNNMTALAEDDTNWNPWGEEFEDEQMVISHHEAPNILWNLELPQSDNDLGIRRYNSTRLFSVEVWGKAAIGLYFWEHIFEGTLAEHMGGVWSYGVKTVSNIKFIFRTGPGVVPDQVPKTAENLLLILNGREPDKVVYAQMWLKSLANLPNLQNVAIVLLGNEQCNNSWLQSYMHYNGGPIDLVFLVYDSPEIDEVNFFQWPLGVATYRGFPRVDSSSLPVHIKRKYSCNFQGTIYRDSSREKLLKILRDNFNGSCYVEPRFQWLPLETDDTREQYIQSLIQSDLTLNPVGQNTECYRIYEALQYGSIPVVEDIMTPGNCGISSASKTIPLRLLKQYDAPIIYVKDWSELSIILENEKTLKHSEKVKRRRSVLLWYEGFRAKMQQKLVGVINKHFFGVTR